MPVHPFRTLAAQRPRFTPRLGLPALLAGCALLLCACAPLSPQDASSRAHTTVSATQPGEALTTLGPVRITWVNPDGFDRERNAPPESERARLAWLGDLGEFLAERATPRLPTGQQLAVRVTAVQRAGGFEPWRGPQDQVRIVRDIYPPRITLSFTRLDADGRTLQTGERELRDNAFQARAAFANVSRDDPLRFEKALVDDWLRREWPQQPVR